MKQQLFCLLMIAAFISVKGQTAGSTKTLKMPEFFNHTSSGNVKTASDYSFDSTIVNVFKFSNFPGKEKLTKYGNKIKNGLVKYVEYEKEDNSETETILTSIQEALTRDKWVLHGSVIEGNKTIKLFGIDYSEGDNMICVVVNNRAKNTLMIISAVGDLWIEMPVKEILTLIQYDVLINYNKYLKK